MPPEEAIPELFFKHVSPRGKKDGHPGNATCRAGATRRATTIRHYFFHRSFSNTRLRTQRLRIIENDVGNIIAIIRQNGPRPVASLPGGLGPGLPSAFLVAAFVSMPHFSDLRALFRPLSNGYVSDQSSSSMAGVVQWTALLGGWFRPFMRLRGLMWHGAGRLHERLPRCACENRVELVQKARRFHGRGRVTAVPRRARSRIDEYPLSVPIKISRRARRA